MWPIVRGSSINGSASIHQSFQMYIILEQFCCSLYFHDGEWSFSLGSELGVQKRLLEVLSFKPYPSSLLEGLEVSPGSALHGLSGEVMGG